MSPQSERAPARVRLNKTDRAHLSRIRVETLICPQVVLRVLGLFAQQSLIPYTIELERRSTRQRLEIEFEDLPSQKAEILVAKIETIPTVRSAKLLRRRRG